MLFMYSKCKMQDVPFVLNVFSDLTEVVENNMTF